MKRDRKRSIKKERIIMIASSAFVLAALTMTGVYLKERNLETEDDGYSLDFAKLEDNVDNKYEEIAQGKQGSEEQEKVEVAQGEEQTNMENDLDYMPMEAGSSLVEIPGLTEGIYSDASENAEGLEEKTDVDLVAESINANEGVAKAEDSETKASQAEDTDTEASAQDVIVSRELNFSEENGLVRPTAGDILMHYSMDGSIYFATLDQYKYNPAVMFVAEEGSVVSACAEGKVVDIFNDAEIGRAVTLDLGNGYEATYGQLKDIEVTAGSYVDAGDVIGAVAAPTKYYSVEGSNLYFQLTKDGNPVNPENLF